mmetsp:Transcript_60758/g.144696  ORF Transcript_60758/g.144696 Transcript_60758/m.144696 type:complete len:349 (+) Transcript_60758:105-1151(+)|eukprot:CAMPEP_0178414230 /NCGR_PEP_ID=MMETSP0689_2-20121128/22931_1 /TAXON_ID=160604 /ORGANISM="Amphidinium massartii, Strain CS-259" /LENGTH=348 /DNA_ID=CAMNT_0020035517 /DNA_START=43 /DNA_END=1089 /DNA_ORIENTATION=+
MFSRRTQHLVRAGLRGAYANHSFRCQATGVATWGAQSQRGPAALVAMAGLGGAALMVSQQESSPAQCAGVNWDDVRAEIVKILEADYKDSSYEGANAGPIFLRLAWHSSGTYCAATKTGGSDGATMRFDPEVSWGANAGLAKAQKLLEPVKKKFPDVSYSDLWILAGCVAIEEMGGNKVPFKPGRKDKADGKSCPVWEGPTHKDGRLPSADMGSPDKTAAHLRYIFNRMGFDDREIVALSGAHGLGACHVENSGFWGPWTRAPTTISTEYFRELLENTWTMKTTHKGKPWTGPLQFEDPTGDLMMLPSDIVLIQDKSFRKWVEVYAKDDAKFQADFAAVVGKLFALGC